MAGTRRARRLADDGTRGPAGLAYGANGGVATPVFASEALEPRRLLSSQPAAPSDAVHAPDATVATNAAAVAGVGGLVIDYGPNYSGPLDSIPRTRAGGSTAVTAAAPLPGLPQFNSLPGAPVAIYLDFNGNASAAMAPYDEDGDPTSFNPTEQQHITDTWREVSAYFAPFDVNVTTVNPSVPMAWDLISNSVVPYDSGYAYLNSFPNTAPGAFNSDAHSRYRRSAIAHEVGHVFGLAHQSDYDLDGNKTNEYTSGPDLTHGEIMGVDYARNVHKWAIGHPSSSPGVVQDDVAVIAGQIKKYEPAGGDGFRADDYAGALAAATPLTRTDGSNAPNAPNASGKQTARGTIERLDDVDAFSFASAGGRISIDVNPAFPSGLAPKVEVYDSAGNLIVARDDTDRRDGSDNEITLPLEFAAGTYYLNVASHGDYGDIGTYDVSVTTVNLPAGWNAQDIGGPVIAGSTMYDPAAGAFHVTGSGYDVWNDHDQEQYAYTSLGGDGWIVARVTNVDGTDPWAKVGLDIRASLTGNDRHADVIASYANGVQLQWRPLADSGSASTAAPAEPFAPVWLKLARSGDSFTAYRSADGQAWTQVGSAVTISMPRDVYVGLMTTAHNASGLNAGVMDNVSAGGGVHLPPPVTSDTLAAPASPDVAPGSGTGLVLTWPAVPGATGYAVERSIDGGTFAQVATTSADQTSYSDANLWGSMRYFYRVRALDPTGVSRPSTASSAVNRPNPPASLTATPWQGDKLVLNWRDVSGETDYRVERSDDGVHFTTVANVGANVPSFTDTGLAQETAYSYRVTAVGPVGDSQVSAVASGTTRLPAPTGFVISTSISIQNNFQWNKVPGAAGYRVERSTDGVTYAVLGTISASRLSYYDGTAAPLTHYYYRVVTLGPKMDGLASLPILVATPTSYSFTNPWKSADIGAPAHVGAAGPTGFTSDRFTVIAGGTDVWGNADQFRFTYVPLIGDGQIVARVSSIEDTDPWAKAGVMIRESLDPGSRNVFAAVTPGNGVPLQVRGDTDGPTSILAARAGATAPYWVKLVRSGNTFSGYSSLDGAIWTPLGAPSTVAMGATVYIGLALTSHSATQLNSATFDNVAVSNSAPAVQTAPSVEPLAASANPVAGTACRLSVLGTDDHGEGNLTYTWTVTQKPSWGSVSFYPNGYNESKSIGATFSTSGDYVLAVKIADAGGLYTQTSFTVTVVPPPWLSAVPGSQWWISGLANAQTLILSHGSIAITADPSSDMGVVPPTNLTVRASNASSIILNASAHLAELTLSSKATGVLASAGADRGPANHRVLVVGAVNIDAASSSRLDLADNDLVLKGGGAAGLTNVRSLISSGYAKHAWNGGGIISSAAAGKTNNALGYALNDGSVIKAKATFGPNDEPVGPADVLVKYTYEGDSNLDGQVSFDDYFYIDSKYPKSSGSTWVTGDFDYNGVTSFDDYFYIDSNYPRNSAL